MSSERIKYITLNDSRIIASAILNFGEKSISLSEYDFSDFSKVQRKVIFGLARSEGSVRYGPAVKSTILSRKQISFDLILDCQEVSIELDGKCIVLNVEPLKAGKFNLELTVFLDRPLEALGEVPDHIKPLLQYSEIVSVVAILSECNGSATMPMRYPGPVYDGADRLGFFLADIDKMDDFIKANSPDEVVDLQKEFCTTEIANDLFAAGLLVLVWGMTPWHYYIYGLATAADFDLVPSVSNPQFSGSYKIREDIKKLSVVPGEQLLNWPLCRAQEWPKIELAGDGEAVAVNVHLRSFDPIHGEFGPSLAVITVHRSNSDPIIEPLLAVDIESVMIEPGY